MGDLQMQQVVQRSQPADGVALLTLSRPKVLNSFDTVMADSCRRWRR
jgi:enoyl-CoA hydratase/carnithine racemase